MQLPLEDLASDILAKASNGLRLPPSVIASLCGISETEALAAITHPESSPHLAVVAESLGIDPVRVNAIAHGLYRPKADCIDGLVHFNTPFEDMTVNAFLIWDPVTLEAAAFDTGSDCDEMLHFAEAKNLRIKTIFLTHAHGDHIYDLDRLIQKTGARAFTPEREPVDGATAFKPGAEFTIGSLTVGTRLTFGHSNGGVTYVIHGLAQPLAVCGDAIFAGSMGGGKVSYADAIRTNREEIFSLPDETILCPGHGPLTSVGEERQNNPFFGAV